MMTLEKMKELIASGESESVEFKKSTSLLSDTFGVVCSFLNGLGGTVLIGVSKHGKMDGQDVSDNTQREIASHIAKLEPCAQGYIHVDYIPIENGKTVIAISVAPGQHIPYAYDGRPYLRNQSTTSRMPQSQYEQLMIKRGHFNHQWDEQVAAGYKVGELDHEEIRRTIESGIREHRIAAEVRNYSIEQMLRHLGLLDDGQVTNAAVVLYAKKMTTLYSHCLIRMTRYRGNDKLSDFMDSKHFRGNAFQILAEANFFTMRHLPIASFFEPNKVQRIDKPALPVMALREALINAISHRDYTERSASISLGIFNDRVELWNNGNLLPPLHLEDLKKPHESFPRNEKIASVFRAGGWVEKAGVGTVRMIEECRDMKIPIPKFKLYSGGLAVIFKFIEPIGVTVKKQKKLSEQDLTVRQKAILSIIEQNENANIQEIISKLENPPSQRMIQKDLNHLKTHGFIELKKAARGSLWSTK